MGKGKSERKGRKHKMREEMKGHRKTNGKLRGEGLEGKG